MASRTRPESTLFEGLTHSEVTRSNVSRGGPEVAPSNIMKCRDSGLARVCEASRRHANIVG